MTLQIVGIVSGVGIVGAFAATQFDLVGPHDLSYLVANLLSAGGLTTVAVLDAQYGFIISNGFWTLVAAVGIARVARRRTPPPTTPGAHGAGSNRDSASRQERQ